MGKRSKEEVTFDELVPLLEDVLRMIDLFRNGEFVSKNKSAVMLREYRKKLTLLGSKLTGARTHTYNVADRLVSKLVAERDQEAHLPDVAIPEKVELPE